MSAGGHGHAGGDAARTTGEVVGATVSRAPKRGKVVVSRVKTITHDLNIGVTPEIDSALRLLCRAWGFTPSQYGRRALIQSLVADGFLAHPLSDQSASRAK